MDKPLRVCLVGYGYWSPKLIRNIKALPEFNLVAICEKDLARHAHIKTEQPGIEIVRHYRDVFAREDIDAVVIATIPSSHYRIAKAALEAGKHVLVEKPLTLHTREGKELVQIAKNKKRLLMVDHTYLYSPAVQELKKLISEGALGSLFAIESLRTNLGLFQRDTNVVWDLAPHDFSILLYLMDEKPYSVQAIGTKTVIHPALKHTQESSAHIILQYKSGITAHVHVSWTSPIKKRQFMVIGSKQMALYDQLEEKQLVVFDQGIYPNQQDGESGPLFEYKIGETTPVEYDTQGEDLSRVLHDFALAIHTVQTPRSDAALALCVVSLLSATQKSILQGGISVPINYDSSKGFNFLHIFRQFFSN